MSNFPVQLKDAGLGFVKIPTRSKKPFEHAWQKRPHPLQEILKWIENGGNFGVMGGSNGLIIIDADNAEISESVRAWLPNTFTVKTPRMGEHFYYYCKEISSKIILTTGTGENKVHFGEIISGGGQVVGPGSIHPDTGTPYIVINDTPIYTISKEEIFSVLHKYIPATEPKKDIQVELGDISVMDIIQKKGIELQKHGGQWGGSHPVHGSTGKQNFFINPEKNVWKCFRCDSGGGALSLIAVIEGIIECSQAKPGGIAGEKFYETLSAAKKSGFSIEKYEKYEKKETAGWAYTDSWAARLFKELYGEKICFCDALGGWLVWNEKKWKIDQTFEIMRLADNVIENIHKKSAETEDKKLRAFAVQREAIGKKKAMIETLIGLEGICVPHDIFDKANTINCLNGTLDLNTLQLTAHDKTQKNTRCVEVNYNPDAKCERWLQFLKEIFDGNDSLIEYVKKAVGYSIGNDIREHCFFVLYGNGRNGKSTFVKRINYILGDYASNSQSSLLTEKKMSSSNAASSDVARLRGSRFVTVSESSRGNSFDEEQIKALTGGEKISARFMYKEPFDFDPTFKIWFSTNHRPDISGTDDGIWSRVKEIPFNRFFGPNEADRYLDEKLEAEHEGIFAWMVEGYRNWQKNGLGTEQTVTSSTETHKDDSDVLGTFFEEMCDIPSPFDTTLSVGVTEIVIAFRNWQKMTRCRSFGRNEIGSYITKKFGINKIKSNQHDNRGWFWHGMSLKVLVASFGRNQDFTSYDRPY